MEFEAPPPAHPRLGSATRSVFRHPPRILPVATRSEDITTPGFPPTFQHAICRILLDNCPRGEVKSPHLPLLPPFKGGFTMARVRSRLVSKRSGLALSGLILTAVASAYSLEVPLGFEGFQFTPPYNTNNPFGTDELMKIDSGFNVFNLEQFAGNGRTCTTCHLPEKNFNITADDIAALLPADQAKVLGGTNTVLENAEIVGTLGLFNINQGFGAGTEGNVDTPLGPFRASMSLGGLGFSTLNRFVCRGGPAAEPTVTMNGRALPLAGAH